MKEKLLADDILTFHQSLIYKGIDDEDTKAEGIFIFYFLFSIDSC
jgi:hypothetical protein